MRKFTKEISALLASVAVGTAAFAGAAAASASADEPIRTEGVMTIADEGIETTCCRETATIGTMAAEDETTVYEEYRPTDPVGTMMPEETTTYREANFPTDPVGTVMGETHTETITTTTVPLPPIAGETMPPPTTEEEPLPPLQGDIAIPDGDITGDGELGVTDVLVFQKWLMGIPRSSNVYYIWSLADLNHDGECDIFDLCLMKQLLIRNTASFGDLVEPEETLKYGNPFETLQDLRLYSGPDKVFKHLADVPKGELLHEIGYMKGNNMWVYTEYNGQYGWIRICQEDNMTSTVEFLVYDDKPVIYLYPEQKTDVHVELELKESELSTTYPKYQNGWDVTAYPDGTLLNKADGTHHRYLFWDSSDCRTRFDLSKGFCVAGSDTERFLKEKLTEMGLTEEERNEFIVYWLPRMEHQAYNLICFQNDAYTNSAILHITPEPDSICRVFMTYVPLENAVEIEPQQFETFERKGFTVVEWGGCEIT